MEEKELFEDYEIRGWEMSPKMYKIFGAAALLQLFVIFTVAQFNLLQTKACDSPYVGKVCQVLDAAYLGSTLLGEDSDFVSKEYVKDEIEDADVTFIDVSNAEPPFTYPEGYFALANPESVTNQTVLPDLNNYQTGSSSPQSLGLDQPQILPTPNNNVTNQPIPDKPFDFGDDSVMPNPKPSRVPAYRPPVNRLPNTKKPPLKNDSPKELPDLDGKETAENNANSNSNKGKPEPTPTPIESEQVAAIEINKLPFEDLGDSINGKLERKEVDLNKPFLVVLDGAIAADGKLDRSKSRFVRSDGDEQMVNVAKDAIESIGSSGFLAYLKNIGVEKINITLIQDDKQVSAIIVSDQKTPEKAKSTASSFNLILSGLNILDEKGIKKLDENSKALIKNSKVTNDGKSFVLNFALPKADAQDLINRSLKERAEKKNNQPKTSNEMNQGLNKSAK
jgi:hypothetical protein